MQDSDPRFKALDLLNELENVTRESLAQYRKPEPQATQPKAQPPAPAATAPQPSRAGEYTSAHEDYQPALRDREIIDALLRLNPKLQGRKPAGAKPQKPAPAVQAVAPQDWGRLHARQQLRN